MSSVCVLDGVVLWDNLEINRGTTFSQLGGEPSGYVHETRLKKKERV